MSYVRFANDSQVYLISTTAGQSRQSPHVIECCGCLLACDYRKPRTAEERAMVAAADPSLEQAFGKAPEEFEWNWAAPQHFTTVGAALAHLQAHRDAGHQVPDRAFDRVRDDDWLSARDGEETPDE